MIKKYAESSLRAAKGNATFLWNALRLQMQPKEQRKRLSGMILISIILNRERTLPIFFRLDLCLARSGPIDLTHYILWHLVIQFASAGTLLLSAAHSRTCDSPDLMQTVITQQIVILRQRCRRTIRMQKGKRRKKGEQKSKKKNS